MEESHYGKYGEHLVGIWIVAVDFKNISLKFRSKNQEACPFWASNAVFVTSNVNYYIKNI